jgi:ATP/maltotriose-dependent transcriptional regulator MalT
MVAYTGECRVYRAEILRRRGDLQQALQEARTASERFASGSEPNAAGLAAYQQGEVQRQRGAFEAAVEAYRAASRAGYEPQPGLALLRLAQGDGDAAASTLRRALAETKSPLRRVRLLPAFIETMLALDAVDEARHAHDELTGIATTCPSDVLDALVEQWRGAIRLAAGDAAAAVAPLRTALETWQALPAPYEAARIQEILSSAYRILDDADGAAFARDAARETYRELGAEWDVSRLEAPTSRSTHGLTPRECEVLALLATGITNRAIGEDLSIAEKTVARHVANIFQKLGVTSRSAATAYAWEHQLIG